MEKKNKKHMDAKKTTQAESLPYGNDKPLPNTQNKLLAKWRDGDSFNCTG